MVANDAASHQLSLTTSACNTLCSLLCVTSCVRRVVANDAASYQYLVESIRMFPDQETWAGVSGYVVVAAGAGWLGGAPRGTRSAVVAVVPRGAGIEALSARCIGTQKLLLAAPPGAADD